MATFAWMAQTTPRAGGFRLKSTWGRPNLLFGVVQVYQAMCAPPGLALQAYGGDLGTLPVSFPATPVHSNAGMASRLLSDYSHRGTRKSKVAVGKKVMTN